MKRAVATALIVLISVGWPAPALAYLKLALRVGPDQIDVRWNGPVPYFIADRGAPGVTAAALRDAVGRAFATWQAVSTASVTSQFQGFTPLPPGFQDFRSTIGFLDRPDLDRVLGATSFLVDGSTGTIIEADIFFNTQFDWSTAPAGEAGRVDLESVALHEIGHLLGLGHSALGETEMAGGGRRVVGSGAVMFPIAMMAGAIADRLLQPDDIAGITDLYPSSTLGDGISSISGRVTKGGAGVTGAHVVAFNLATGALVGGFSLNAQGEYVIAGLTPGTYLIRVEPLDDAEIESFFGGVIDVDFKVAFGSRLVVAPRGGSSDALDIQVQPK
jgi:hypothetical protein